MLSLTHRLVLYVLEAGECLFCVQNTEGEFFIWQNYLNVTSPSWEAALPVWGQHMFANAGGLKIAVFEKYPAQGVRVYQTAPWVFALTPDTPEAQKSAYEVFARFSNYSKIWGLISKMLKYSSEIPKIICEECKIEAPMIVRRNPAEYGTQRGYTVGHANGSRCWRHLFSERPVVRDMLPCTTCLRLMLEKKGVEFFSRPRSKKNHPRNRWKSTGVRRMM